MPSLTVLAVDDNKCYLSMLNAVFESAGMAVHLAENAESALEMVKGQAFDLVVTDLCMPGMDGIELSMMIKDIVPDLPIIMLTAAMTSKVAALARGAGIKRVLDKYTSTKDIVRIVVEEAAKRETIRNFFPVDPDECDNPSKTT